MHQNANVRMCLKRMSFHTFSQLTAHNQPHWFWQGYPWKKGKVLSPLPIPAGLIRQIQNRRQDCLIILFTSNLNSSSSGLQLLRTHRSPRPRFRNRDEIQKSLWQQMNCKAANHTAQTTTDSKQWINRDEHCKQKKELGLIQVLRGLWNWTKNISLKCK